MSLVQLQNELRVGKDQLNKFGGYNYRTTEGILEAVKPLLLKHDAEMIMWDDIHVAEGRVYVKANVRLIFADGKVYESAGFARESLSKKGMDESQITGAASSYASKRALGNLLLLDDSKDADSTNDHSGKKEALKVGTDKFKKAQEWIWEQANQVKALEGVKNKYTVSKEVETALLNEGTEL